MKNNIYKFGVLVSGLVALPLLAVNYLLSQLSPLPFAPYSLFNWLVRVLPGPLLTFGIDRMIDTLRFLGINVADTAKLAERGMAVLLLFITLALAGTVVFSLLAAIKSRVRLLAGLLAGALAGSGMIALGIAVDQTGAPVVIISAGFGILFIAWGLALAWGAGRVTTPRAPAGLVDADPLERRAVQSLSRRQFLITLGAAAATITVVGSGVAAALSRAEQRRREEAFMQQVGQTNVPLPNLDDPVIPAPGTRPEYTPLQDHYKVFLSTEPTLIDGQDYRLPISGLVDNPLTLSLEDIRSNYTSFDQFVTLSCISGRIGTTLISTTQWTGVSMQDILADAGVRPEAKYLFIESGDGFYEAVDLDLIRSDPRIMLCYAWDGGELPVDHGYPLRIWIPDRFGMKQPKWITSMELVSDEREGYWVERGWSKTARVRTTSVIDTVAVDSIDLSGTRPVIPVGGIAWAGDRQISKVELRVDGGPWQEALLRTPLSGTTWVIWRFDWPFEEGHHVFEVRCQEGDGSPQIEEQMPNRPDGATGIHSEEVDI